MSIYSILNNLFLIGLGLYMYFYFRGRFAKTEKGKQAISDFVESCPSWITKIGPPFLVVVGILRLVYGLLAPVHDA